MREFAIALGIVGGMIILIALTITIGETFGFLPVLYSWGATLLLISFIIYKRSKQDENN